MSKHSTTPRTLSRRLAALLAALALLAAMALPVYAEALDGATGTAQAESNGATGTAQAEIGDTISDGTVTTENEPTTPAGEEETEDSTANVDADDASENTEIDVDADDESSDTEDTDASDETNDTISEDSSANSESPEDDQQDAGETEEISTASDFATQSEIETFRIYFVAPSSWGTLTDSDEVWCYGRKNGANENEQKFDKIMNGTEVGWVDGVSRKVYYIELTTGLRDANAVDCPWNGLYRLHFYVKNSDKSCQAIENHWTDIGEFRNKCYNADDAKWVTYTTVDPNDHTRFKEKQMAFKNATADTLTNVVARFYEKDESGNLQELLPQEKKDSVAPNEKVIFTIPSQACSYVQFTAENNGTAISSSLYNFYGQTGDEESFLYNEKTQFCFVYSTNNMAHWGTGEGQRTIYYDATFSKLSADTGFAIPSNVGGTVYYYLTGKGIADKAGEMARQTNDLYSVDIEPGYDHIIFGAYEPTSQNDVAVRGNSTANLKIPDEYTSPCFYADTGDDSTYGGADWHTNLTRDGYWAEVNTLRNAEANKVGKTVVDVPEAEFKADSSTKYIDTTLYDYYTDWELNGNNRDNYKVNNGASQRNWVTFRQFDQALSDYYQSDTKQTVLYPIYTGHFQPNEIGGELFSNVASALNLYGWDQYNTFMAVNNSYKDIDGKINLANPNNKEDKNNYVFTFQGLVSDTLNKDGNPTLYNTNLAEPHFNKAFLEGDNSKNAVLGKVYENVSFPFTKEKVFDNGVDYWYYDAGKKSLYLKQGTDNKYFLQAPDSKGTDDRSQNVDSGSKEQGTYGFFPFNEGSTGKHANTYNYGFGAKLQFDFTLTDDGQVLDNKGSKVPIQFFFSGDDDVWVYIDNELALDVGGAHGKASGLLEFGPKKDGKNTYTAYVSKVKAGNKDQSYTSGANKSVTYLGSQISFNYQSEEKTLTPGKHTLRLFYMERGMWESNMAIAFNFPDNNELQVEKNVDIREVDSDFKACFTNQKLFNFTILNQATHYGPKAVEEGSVQQVPPKKLSSNDYTLGRMGNLENNSNNYCRPEEDPAEGNTGQVIHWYAEYDDTHSNFRNDRMGVITLKESVDITGMDYLSFYIYASGIKGEGTLSLSNMYLQLVDSSGKVLGCIDKESLSGTTYNQVDLKNNEWIKIKLDLSRLNVHGEFDKTHVAAIRIGDNFQRDIYFKDFTFTANPTIKKITGFTTEQKDIPDYGSAADGELKLAESAQFSSSIDGKTRAVDENGQFTLQDKEVVTFSDQFRRGSYLSVTEDADPALFDTTWTIYENGVSVKTMNSGKTVQNADTAPSVVEQRGYTPNDGRTENVVKDAEQADNKYKKAEKPDGDKTIVFRSYTNPDAGDAAELTKLKLQFVNKVKTGSLTIKKVAAEDEDDEIKRGTYTFTVTFANVGGLGLESKPIVKEVKITGVGKETITGIPVGTRFHIVETNATNNANVSSVTVSGGKDCKVVNGKEAIGSIVEYKQDDPNTVAVATFTNTTRTLIDIDLTKKWVDANNEPLADDKLDKLPRIIYVQLQRKTKDDEQWTEVRYPEGENKDYVAVERDQGGWTHKFANLDATAWNSPATPEYEYRVVEGTLEKKGDSTTFKPVGDDGILIINGNAYKAESTTAEKGKATITLTNRRLNPKFTLDVTKKSAENDGENDQQKLLAGVEFTLEKMKDDGTGKLVVDSSFKRTGVTNGQGELMLTDSSGKVTQGFTELKAGTYRLTETKAAKDYNLLSAPIVITFTKDGQCRIGNDALMQAKNDTIFTGDAVNGYKLALTVLNRKTPALPHTGADAPSLWLLIGLPLAVAGLLILVFRYNKKGGRTR